MEVTKDEWSFCLVPRLDNCWCALWGHGDHRPAGIAGCGQNTFGKAFVVTEGDIVVPEGRCDKSIAVHTNRATLVVWGINFYDKTGPLPVGWMPIIAEKGRR